MAHGDAGRSSGRNFTGRNFTGACHCGAVRFAAEIDLASARRCNCSFCRMRGAVAVTAGLEDFAIVKGEEALALYTFGTGTAKHYFCRHCGIYTHHQRRSDPRELGINAACLDGVSPFDFAEVPVTDGVAHRSDTGIYRIFGVLRFERGPD
ncbi:MAG: GFA family protein [Novosphingobium sp.]|nr:GFA family protein [Novosphingobium sp.]